MQTNNSSKGWEEAVEIWSKQGRTEEQMWAVKNFLTGAGANLIKEVERAAEDGMLGKIGTWVKEAEERGFQRGVKQGADDMVAVGLRAKERARADERKRIVGEIRAATKLGQSAWVEDVIALINHE